MARWIVIGLLVAGGIGAGIFLASPRGIPVLTATAKVQTIRTYIQERAKTQLPEVHRITMPLQGRILPIEIEEGEWVTANQIVARLDTQDLDTDLQEAKNSVEQYVQGLEQLLLTIKQSQQTVIASQERYEFYEREFSRVAELFRRKTLAESSRNQAELSMIESRVELRKDELDRDIYSIGKTIFELLRDNEIGKRDKAERNRKRAEIRTPVAGTVLNREVSNERVLQAGEVLLEIGNLNQLEVVVEVLTQDAVRIQVGDSVDIQGAALGTETTIGPETISGHVSRVFPQGFTKVSSLGVEQQRVNVIVKFGPDELAELQKKHINLGADFRLRVKIYTDERQQAIVVPRSAIFRSTAGKWQTFVVGGQTAELRTVQVGLQNEFEVEIISGVTANERVILAPESEMVNGQRVEVTAPNSLDTD
ncbi:MAG: HlyD family efflux transporter periplasmic adaptor subunit [Planctomycetaceae bacterium]|nr:HlyD family efflux transporter periplasmic adaptor subunit [Planctomycetaceae bacterium]